MLRQLVLKVNIGHARQPSPRVLGRLCSGAPRLRIKVGVFCLPKTKLRNTTVTYVNGNGDSVHTGEDSYMIADSPAALAFGACIFCL